MNCARILLKNTSKSVSRVFRRNFGETAVHKNIWIEEHNGIKEDLTNRFEWSGQNIMNSIVFLGLIPCFIYIVGKNAQDVGRFVPRLSVETVRDSRQNEGDSCHFPIRTCCYYCLIRLFVPTWRAMDGKQISQVSGS